jgi:hypothetical protein
MISGRGALAGIAAASLAQSSGLARPAQAAGAKSLSIVPQATLNSVDPIWSASRISRWRPWGDG